MAVTRRGIRRRDAFHALAGSLTFHQRDAADRLLADVAELYGVAGSFGVGRTDPSYSKGAARLFSLRRMEARERLEGVFGLIGRADQALLLAIAEPIVLGSATASWRDQVARVTGEKQPQPQAVRIRAALENLRLAYGLGEAPVLHPFSAAPEELVGSNEMLACMPNRRALRPSGIPPATAPGPSLDRGPVVSGPPEAQAVGRQVLQRVLVFTQVAASQFGDKGQRSSAVSYARALAAYLLHVELRWEQRDCAAVLPMTQQAVSEACARIEELREDAALDTAIDILAEELRRRFTGASRPANDN